MRMRGEASERDSISLRVKNFIIKIFFQIIL